MKLYSKLGALALISYASSASAVNPMDGVYAGLVLGGSYAPKTNIIVKVPAYGNDSSSGNCVPGNGCTPTYGTLTYGGYGNIGGQIGYRMKHLRLEVEPWVNYNPYERVLVGSTTFYSPKNSTGIRIKGDTSTYALMFNGIYDFYSEQDGCYFAPYLGLGLGYGAVHNENRFYCNDATIACSVSSDTAHGLVGQGIIGLGYYMDDFTWFGLDYRYVTSRKADNLDARLRVHTINLSISGMFYCL